MPLTDPQRINHQACKPRIVALWHTLQSLKSCVSFMNTGAHPDDETSAMLSALSLRDGLSISYACVNRGEGGQNELGSEATQDLGVLRTAEMERAAEALNLRLYWLSESPEDTLFDFGFSKSGVETLSKWGETRTLQRLVEIIRIERPDIIAPTFLDIPGQHGHHRAITQTTHAAMHAAADPAFKTTSSQLCLQAWQVKKMYLPAWSGAGDAYDDDVPPPPTTLSIEAQGQDPVSGWSYAQIAQHSRVFHRTQGMGRWVGPGQAHNWPLHLAQSTLSGPDTSISSGLPATLAELAQFANADSLAKPLLQAQQAIDNAITVFPELAKIQQHITVALREIRIAKNRCPKQAHAEVMHRLAQKEYQLSQVIRLTSQVSVRGWLSKDVLQPGESVTLQVESSAGDAQTLSIEAVLPTDWAEHDDDRITVGEHCPPSNPYPSQYCPGEPDGPKLRVSIDIDGELSETWQALEVEPLVLPGFSARLAPASTVLNIATARRSIQVQLSEQQPGGACAKFVAPAGWIIGNNGHDVTIKVPDEITTGLYTLPLQLDGNPASTVVRIDYPHIPARIRTHQAALTVRALHASLPSARIGYVGAGNDKVAQWLSALGLPIKQLSDADLATSAILRTIDTLLVGIFAVRKRPALQINMPRIHDWIDQGGNLLTLYHRPWDNWNPQTIPPRPLSIGKPSLRWRITDEQATVTHLIPDHPLLNTPNCITAEDWSGWHKERGLYFANAWDPVYAALLSMADPDEAALTGGLLSARIGAGRHTHTSLILHHQMEKLVPGAFRLMANLVAPVE